MNVQKTFFPFAAVVGQEEVKLALLLNAVSSEIGGVLIRGPRGTAKTTLARGITDLFPEINVVKGCPFRCDPDDTESLCSFCTERLRTGNNLQAERARVEMITLPLNATEEMVVGALDIEKALRVGEKSFQPGILARANRGILYVDEVNLLDNHIVDILLDSAAMGTNIVEREGISLQHSARFLLIGTMNPEEGELRPQLEDRFGLCAEIETEASPEQRLEIIRRNLEFRRNPFEFEAAWHHEQERLRKAIKYARDLYPKVTVPESAMRLICEISTRAGIDGHRFEISTMFASRALAALEGRSEVDGTHVFRTARLGLRHRLSDLTLKGPDAGADAVDAVLSALIEQEGEHKVTLWTPTVAESRETVNHFEEKPPSGQTVVMTRVPKESGALGRERASDRGNEATAERPPGPSFPLRGMLSGAGFSITKKSIESQTAWKGPPNRSSEELSNKKRPPGPQRKSIPGKPTGQMEIGKLVPDNRAITAVSGKRGQSSTCGSRGRYCKHAGPEEQKRGLATKEISIDGTLRNLAVKEIESRPVKIEPGDVRYKVRKTARGAAILFVVDTSASMSVRKRLESSISALEHLLGEAYLFRDKVGLVTFGGSSANLILPLSSSHRRLSSILGRIETGGATPLSSGLSLALRTLSTEISKKPSRIPILVLVSDCGANMSLRSKDPIAESLEVAREIRKSGIQSIVIDQPGASSSTPVGERHSSRARTVAQELGAVYLEADDFSVESLCEKIRRFRKS